MLKIHVAYPEDALDAFDLFVLPVLVEKMMGRLPDPSDSATLAYTVLRGITARIRRTPDMLAFEHQISNDAATAMRAQLVEHLQANGPQRDIEDILMQIIEHMEEVGRVNAERRSEFVRRNSVPVREARRVRHRPKGKARTS